VLALRSASCSARLASRWSVSAAGFRGASSSRTLVSTPCPPSPLFRQNDSRAPPTHEARHLHLPLCTAACLYRPRNALCRRSRPKSQHALQLDASARRLSTTPPPCAARWLPLPERSRQGSSTAAACLPMVLSPRVRRQSWSPIPHCTCNCGACSLCRASSPEMGAWSDWSGAYRRQQHCWCDTASCQILSTGVLSL